MGIVIAVAESFETRYRMLLAAVRSPAPDNWHELYNNGLSLERVEQGRRLVAATPMNPETKSMLDLQNARAGPAWNDFVSIKSNLVPLAPVWSNQGWNLLRE